MEVTFIAGLYNLALDPSMEMPIQIGPSLKLGCGAKLADRLIPPTRQKMIGSVEYTFLATQPFAYWQEDIEPFGDAAAYHHEKIRILNYLLHWTWVHEDNAVNVDRAYVFFRTDGRPDVFSNFVGLVNSDSQANYRRTMAWDNSILNFIRDMAPKGNLPKPAKVTTSKPSRLDRGMWFISAARAAPEIGMKVIFFCSALEALFSSSTSEIAQLLSVRASIYAFPPGEERFLAYKRIKKAYDIRSKTIHGELPKDSDNVAEASFNCDAILRAVYTKAYAVDGHQALFAEKPDSFTEKFNRAQLGLNVDDINKVYDI